MSKAIIGRHPSRKVQVGKVPLGGGAPIVVQSMTNTDTADVEATLPLMTAVDYDRDLDLGDGLWARFTRAGHILGSSSVRVETPSTSVLFSGDLGRHDHPVLRPREIPLGAAYVLVESTYGDREHPEPRELPHEGFADVIRRTVARGGSVLVPAFAVDRTEVVLKTLSDLRRDGRIPRVPVVVNSPMALDALQAYRDNATEMRAELDLHEILGDWLLYTSDDAAERPSVDIGGRRIIKKKKTT